MCEQTPLKISVFSGIQNRNTIRTAQNALKQRAQTMKTRAGAWILETIREAS